MVGWASPSPTTGTLFARERGDENRHALLVGINAYPTKRLKGCVNDMTRLKTALNQELGFPAANVTTLFDTAATRRNILAQIERYQRTVPSGGLFFFGYSGHGTPFPDDYSRERDETRDIVIRTNIGYAKGRYDSAIVPIDSMSASGDRPWRNLILDDELFDVFSKFTSKGVTVILFSDSCHSGTLARSFNSGKDGETVDRYLTPDTALGVSLDKIPAPRDFRSVTSRDMNNRYLAFTSSLDSQASIEVPSSGSDRSGLFTDAFLNAVRRLGGRATYRRLFRSAQLEVVQRARQYRHEQEPQLDDRYFKGNLDAPIFGSDTVEPSALRIVVKVTDQYGRPLPESKLCIFKLGLAPAKGRIRETDTFFTAKTDWKGLFDADTINVRLPAGTYRFKVTRVGYRSFEGERTIRRDGDSDRAVVLFQLVKE